MKNGVLLAVTLFAATAVTAQQPLIQKITPAPQLSASVKAKLQALVELHKQYPKQSFLVPLNKLKNPADTTGDNLQELLKAYHSNSSLLPLAVYSHSTAKGKVYKLPYDHMPCLVPDMKQVTPMPGNYGPFPEYRMPNPVPKYAPVPKEKEDRKDNK